MRILNLPVFLVLFSAAVASANGPTIDIWYGPVQQFGQLGNPQQWINILGNVSDPNGVASLSYTLNGGSSSLLATGPDGRRLGAPGDFNIDIHTTDLNPGSNQVVITAVDYQNNQSVETVTVEYTSGNEWPLPYSVDWSSVSKIHDVAQVVDGVWALEGGGVRMVQSNYDRIVALGDTSWTDYEVTVPVTINNLDFSNARPGLGLLLRWNGHTDDPINGWQPKTGWNPFGAIGWWRWDHPGSAKLEFWETGIETGYTPTVGVTYLFKARVETVAQGALYSIKVWPASESEPANWDLTYQAPSSSGLAKGSMLLLAHRTDATYGNIIVTPLDVPEDTTPPTAPGNFAATPVSQSQIDLMWNAASDPESGVALYKIYRDGAAVGSTSGLAFSDLALSESTSYTYQVSAVNGAGLEGPVSDSASATTLAVPPQIVSVETVGDPTAVVVSFSEELDQLSAETATNYTIDNGVVVVSASLGVDQTAVTLTTSELVSGITYTLGVANVEDLSGNPIASGAEETFEFIEASEDEYELDGNTIALYHFNSGFEDAGVNGLHLTAQGGAHLAADNLGWMSSPIGQVLRLQSAGHQATVTISDNLLLPGSAASELTIEAWIYPRDYVAYGVGNLPVISLHQNYDTKLEVLQRKWDGGRAPRVETGKDKALINSGAWNANVSLNEWQLLRITLDGSSTASVYVDDVLVGSHTASMNYGRSNPWTLVLGNIDADIDEVRISNVVRTGGQPSAKPTLASLDDSESAFVVEQNHPNPFNPSTTIRYSLPEPLNVHLAIYNTLGQQVQLLVNNSQTPGQHAVVWDGRDALGRPVASGTYFYRLQAGPHTAVRKMLFIK